MDEFGNFHVGQLQIISASPHDHANAYSEAQGLHPGQIFREAGLAKIVVLGGVSLLWFFAEKQCEQIGKK